LHGLFDCPRLQRNSSFCQVSGDQGSGPLP
jgi:hypothetical protein